jgi:hypothetical protein
LDSNFVLFVEKQKFFYALFDKVLLTDKGKLLVRQYASTFDAQKFFCDRTVYANTSTMAAQEAADLLTYITSSKFGDGTWKGKAHGFILIWQGKVRQYESILPVKDHLTATIKGNLLENERNLLENAVGQVHELRAVKAQTAQHKAQNGGIDLTYEQYCSLLSSAAQEYYGSLVRSVKTAPSAARRSIYYTKFEPRKIEDEFFDVAYDIDTSPNDILEANVHGFGGPRLNVDQWGRLPKEAQEKWDQLDQASKSITLEHKLRPPPPRRRCARPPSARLWKALWRSFCPQKLPSRYCCQLT